MKKIKYLYLLWFYLLLSSPALNAMELNEALAYKASIDRIAAIKEKDSFLKMIIEYNKEFEAMYKISTNIEIKRALINVIDEGDEIKSLHQQWSLESSRRLVGVGKSVVDGDFGDMVGNFMLGGATDSIYDKKIAKKYEIYYKKLQLAIETIIAEIDKINSSYK